MRSTPRPSWPSISYLALESHNWYSLTFQTLGKSPWFSQSPLVGDSWILPGHPQNWVAPDPVSHQLIELKLERWHRVSCFLLQKLQRENAVFVNCTFSQARWQHSCWTGVVPLIGVAQSTEVPRSTIESWGFLRVEGNLMCFLLRASFRWNCGHFFTTVHSSAWLCNLELLLVYFFLVVTSLGPPM